MRTIETLADAKFVKLNKVMDVENNVKAYLFAERLGVDSVAFVCRDPEVRQVLLNKEYKPSVNAFILGAFGGSIDKNKSLTKIVQDEAKEEAGFVVSEDNIIYLGKSFVSTQMNQYCHLFVVLVEKDEEGEREPENAIEAMAKTEWVDDDEILNPSKDVEDWKAITIMAKYMASL